MPPHIPDPHPMTPPGIIGARKATITCALEPLGPETPTITIKPSKIDCIFKTALWAGVVYIALYLVLGFIRVLAGPEAEGLLALVSVAANAAYFILFYFLTK